MRSVVFLFTIVTFLLLGCASNEQLEGEPGHDKEPIWINTKDDKQYVIDKRPATDYIESKEQGVGKYGTKQNIFNSREEREISQALAKRQEVVQSRVAVTPNRVVVFASLNDYPTHIKDSIREDVSRFVNDKEIIVFTDEAQWERMKQLEGGLRQKEIGEDLEDFLEEHFKLDIKD